MCFLSHDKAVCLFPSESFIHHRSLVNLTGRRLTYLPGTGYAYAPAISLVPFKELNMYETRALVSMHLKRQAQQIVGLDYHQSWGLRVPYTPMFIRSGSEDDVGTFCTGNEITFLNDTTGHDFFPKETRSLTDQRTWSRCLWSKYAQAPSPGSCNLVQNVAWLHESFIFAFGAPAYVFNGPTPWPQPLGPPSNPATVPQESDYDPPKLPSLKFLSVNNVTQSGFQLQNIVEQMKIRCCHAKESLFAKE
jgi:hypothetical protein